MAELNLKDIEDNYARMSDYELERIATKDAIGLLPEVYLILEKEIQKRNLDLNLTKGIEAQQKKYTIAEIDSYCNVLMDLSCPICNSKSQKLNATLISTVKSFLIITSYKRELKIACPNCLIKELDKAIISTALLGWWGFPWGIIKTPMYIYYNFDSKKEAHNQMPNNELRSFVLANIGKVATSINIEEKLFKLIKFI